MTGKPAVAVVHYHLRPGGVTRVIERAIESLDDQVDILVLTGEAPSPGDALAPISELFPPLGYSDHPPERFENRVEELRLAARNRLGRDPDLWHIHNHSLGKNSFMPLLVRHLAHAGCRLLLQPHDFAEDGRPGNYRLLSDHIGPNMERILYPVADHVWYAPINLRDKTFLEGIGLPHVHALPNAVTEHATTSTRPAQHRSSEKTIVYPARAIRRKNMGEFLLWSLLAPEGYTFQSTLAPQNPVWQRYYNEWVAFAEKLNLPVEFDVGRTRNFAELVQDAEALISTSVAEGFGLAFLEPWLEGKMLIGRKLSEITNDFEQEGLNLSSLYSALPVPLEWAGEKEFFDALESAMRGNYASYSKTWRPEYFEEAKAALVNNGSVDFGILDETLQRNVIRHLAEHPSDRNRLPPFSPHPSSPLIAHNRQMVKERYSLQAYGQRLMAIYRSLAAVPPGPVSAANASDLLDEFLQPARINLLRT
jgi:glycosyltransferase involved in cell wall biosynthesis